MWKCPKCGRTFKRTNQDHYCREAPVTIEEYIKRQPEQVQPYLEQINQTIRSAIPDTAEKISWSMPTYWKKRPYESPKTKLFSRERKKQHEMSILRL